MNSVSKLRFVCFSCLAGLAAVLPFAGPDRMEAQSAADATKIAATLPADTRAVIDRLSSLRELPDGTWKLHAGDLAHGEQVSLDDSGWQPITPRSKAPKDAVWFRQTYQIPATLNGYDLTGARIWFQFHAYANGPMPEILYFNGRRVAMGDDLEPVVLFDNAKPGDKVTVAIKLLHTVDDKNFQGATLKIDFPESRPNPEDLREELLSAALLVPSLAPNDPSKTDTLNAAIRAVNIAALEHAQSNSAITRSESQFEFDTSLKIAHVRLEALKPLLQQATYHLTGNSHIDAAWLWPWTETVDVVKRTFGTALQLMYEYPEYTYTQSAAAYNEWIADKYPEMNAEIARRIKEGRWEIVGGMWVEPDLNMPDGESLVRQLLVGKRWFKQQYGVDTRIGWNPDSFGYTWQLPQIYKKSGIDYFVTQKMAWCDTNQLPFKFFWWESPDGSKVLTYFPHDYANDNLNPVRLARDFTIAQKQATGLPGIMDLYGIGDHGGGPTRAILDEGFHWEQPGANGTSHVTPKIEFGTAQSYFTTLEKQIVADSPVWDYQSIVKGYKPPPAVPGKVNIPTWKSELYFEYHRGVMTTQANHKRNMREAEVEVLNAEKWASLAWVLAGRAYPAAELTEDWKKVLFNQFHDTAAGSGIGVIYKDAQKDYDVVKMSTDAISVRALDRIVSEVDTRVKMAAKSPNRIPHSEGMKGKQWDPSIFDGNKKPQSQALVVFNPLGWKRSGTVTVHIPGQEGFTLDDPETGIHLASYGLYAIKNLGAMNSYDYEIPVEGVPPFGYKTLRITTDCNEPSCSMTEDKTIIYLDDFKPNGVYKSMTVRNDFLTVKIDWDTGCLRSIFENSTGFDYIVPGGCGNELQFFKDTPKDYDAWNIDPGTLDKEIEIPAKADEVIGYGNDGFRVTKHFGNSKFIQTIKLDGDQIDVDNEIDWHESHVLLKAAFPLAASGPFATYEIPYGTIDRPTTRNNSWEQAQFEVPAMRWGDLSGLGPDGKIHGLSILNQNKYGYDAVGNVLRLTLLRSPKWPDAEADMGHHHFHYALYPHAGTWKEALTVRHGYEYNYPLTAVVTTAHPGSLPASHSFASVSPENVVLTAVKKAEDANGLIFRVYEWAGKETTAEFHVPPGATGATVTNLMEQPQGDPLPVTGDVVKAPIHPYEILTIRVDYPTTCGGAGGACAP
ncbi:MAG TPA: glycoside hydrolase family 38 C-terminal domain-containing protein [Terracidiphilus sp.]|jgi:alpha-mannosidase